MKKILKIALVVIVVIGVVFVGISAYLGYTMTRVEREPVTGSPTENDLAYEDVTFPSEHEDLTLHGWFIPAYGSDRVIIIVHGNGYHRNPPGSGFLDIAERLVENDFNVLMFDLHGFGESEGSTVSGGYFEKDDLKGAVAYVSGRGFRKIGVLGFSMGAVASLMAAAEDSRIDAVVSDSAYADLNDIIEPEFAKRTKAPGFFLHPILFMIKLMFGVDFTAVRPVDSVAKIAPRPIFFIHGEKDDVIPVEHTERLFEASDNPANELWIVAGGHTSAYHDHPEQFLGMVISFFDGALK